MMARGSGRNPPPEAKTDPPVVDETWEANGCCICLPSKLVIAHVVPYAEGEGESRAQLVAAAPEMARWIHEMLPYLSNAWQEADFSDEEREVISEGVQIGIRILKKSGAWS